MPHKKSILIIHTLSLPLANFVGIVVGFLNVLSYTPRRLLLAASLSFGIKRVYVFELDY